MRRAAPWLLLLAALALVFAPTLVRAQTPAVWVDPCAAGFGYGQWIDGPAVAAADADRRDGSRATAGDLDRRDESRLIAADGSCRALITLRRADQGDRYVVAWPPCHTGGAWRLHPTLYAQRASAITRAANPPACPASVR